MLLLFNGMIVHAPLGRLQEWLTLTAVTRPDLHGKTVSIAEVFRHFKT